MTTASNHSAPRQDRRVAQRFQPAFGTIYRFKKPENEYFAVGLVWNISQTGVSMLLADPPERGGIVPGELTTESGGPGLSIEVRIVHVRPLSTGDYLLGAQFSRPLDDEEMKQFLTPQPTPETSKQTPTMKPLMDETLAEAAALSGKEMKTTHVATNHREESDHLLEGAIKTSPELGIEYNELAERHTPPDRQEVFADARWVNEMQSTELFDQYRGKYIAVANRTVQATGDSDVAATVAGAKAFHCHPARLFVCFVNSLDD